MKSPRAAGASALPQTAGTLAGLPVTCDRALQIASEQMAESAVERLELKREQGDWTYKIKGEDGRELWISATSGSSFLKAEYQRVRGFKGGRAGAVL